VNAVGYQALRLGQHAHHNLGDVVSTRLTPTLTQVLRDAAAARSEIHRRQVRVEYQCKQSVSQEPTMSCADWTMLLRYVHHPGAHPKNKG
jgi:hypothetical protein